MYLGGAGGLLGVALLGIMFTNARADPIVRRTALTMAGMAPGKSVRVVLLSDIHIGSATMDGRRLSRIIDQVNALQPDIVLIAGDFIAGHQPQSAAQLGAPMVAPLARLHAPLGVVAVLGNHDHLTGELAVRRMLDHAGIAVLDNQAIVRGLIAIGGIGDDATHHANVGATLRAVRALRRPFLLLTHAPDVSPRLPPDARLLLAGHTHCGQIVLPLIGLLPDASRFGVRHWCGVVRERGRMVIVSAGLGTSILPLRLNAPPDLWVITLEGSGALLK